MFLVVFSPPQGYHSPRRVLGADGTLYSGVMEANHEFIM